MLKQLFLLALLPSVLLLSACGEGYEMVRTDKYTPYGNSRTAGTGVAYVLKNMMPEKKVKVEAPVNKEEVVEEVKAKVPEASPQEKEIINDIKKNMEKIFEKRQTK